MNADVLNQSSNQVASVLEAVRNEALSFADRLHTIQGGVRLQGFDPHSFFEKAVKEAYEHLQDAFLRSRMCFGRRPDINDYEIKREFFSDLDCHHKTDIADLNITAAVKRAMSSLDTLLPSEAAENEVSRQLAARFNNEFRLEHKEVVQRGGFIVLSYGATIDSLTKQYDKRNDYSYHTNEWICKQLAVLQEMVVHFNRSTGKNQPTNIVTYYDLQQHTRALSRSPKVIDVCGFKLKFGVSRYEFHLSPEFAEHVSTMISLHNH